MLNSGFSEQIDFFVLIPLFLVKNFFGNPVDVLILVLKHPLILGLRKAYSFRCTKITSSFDLPVLRISFFLSVFFINNTLILEYLIMDYNHLKGMLASNSNGNMFFQFKNSIIDAANLVEVMYSFI